MSETAANTTILLVDDEPNTRNALTELLRDEGYVVRGASDAFKALGLLDGWAPQILLTDVHMPGMSGVELMERVTQRIPGVATVVMTAYGSVDDAVHAMQAGADAYMIKPIQFSELLLVIERLHDEWALRRENEQLQQAVDQREVEEIGWVGHSRPARELVAHLHQVATSDATVLVRGERGAGKRFVARVLHRLGPRNEGPLCVVQCRALDESMQERELFGGGDGEGAGAMIEARGGTLVLCDVEELSNATQARLLDGLRKQAEAPAEERVRVIATTRLDLGLEVGEGRFREDLYYTLNVLAIEVPSLRQRRDDIPELAMHFAKRHASKHRKYIRRFTPRALRALVGYMWPGNVRQLDAVAQRAVLSARRRDIEPKDLPRDLMAEESGTEAPVVPGASMAELERHAIMQTLAAVDGSTKRAAKILGISTRKVQYRVSEYRDTGSGDAESGDVESGDVESGDDTE